MNSAKLQDTRSIYRNDSYFYTWEMDSTKMKVGTKFYLKWHENNGIAWYKPNSIYIRSMWENYKSLMKEIKEDLRRNISCSWIGRQNILKCQFFPFVL